MIKEEEISIVMAGQDLLREAEACLEIYSPAVLNTHSNFEMEVPTLEV